MLGDRLGNKISPNPPFSGVPKTYNITWRTPEVNELLEFITFLFLTHNTSMLCYRYYSIYVHSKAIVRNIPILKIIMSVPGFNVEYVTFLRGSHRHAIRLWVHFIMCKHCQNTCILTWSRYIFLGKTQSTMSCCKLQSMQKRIYFIGVRHGNCA